MVDFNLNTVRYLCGLEDFAKRTICKLLAGSMITNAILNLVEEVMGLQNTLPLIHVPTGINTLLNTQRKATMAMSMSELGNSVKSQN